MKRLIAAPLWFFVGWYVGAAAAWVTGMSSLLGPTLALAFGAIVYVDPRRVVWGRASGSAD